MKPRIPILMPIFAFMALLAAVAPAVAPAVASVVDEMEFRDATVQDAIRTIAELTGTNIVATREAGQRRFTLYLRHLTVDEAIDSIARVAGLWHRRNERTGVYLMMTTEEYFRDIIVLREELTEMFTLRYQNVLRIGRTIEAMFGPDRVRLDLQEDAGDDLELPGGTLGSGGRGTQGGTRAGSRGATRSGRSAAAGRSGGGSSRSVKEQYDGMTPEQLDALEEVLATRGGKPLVVPEEVLARGRQDNQVPIFVAVNREHNQIFVRTADRQALEEIRRIVRDSDRPTPQVLLEMKVMSVALEDGFRSAFDFSYTGVNPLAGPADGQPANPLQPSDGEGPERLLGIVNPQLVAGSSFVFQAMNDNIRVRLELLQREGRINVLATPLLLASNNRPARIFIGEQTVLTTGFETQETAGGGGNNTVITTPVPETEVVEVGNTLTILPSINADRTVFMRLIQESSRVQPDGGRIPVVVGDRLEEAPIDTIDKSTIEGTAMAKDGLTVVIGGMITESRADGVRKVPVLGDIPLLGQVFRDVARDGEKSELVLLITPHVFTTPEEAEAISRQRVDDLVASPNQVDVYLDQLDRNRAQTRRGRDINAAVERASPVPLTTDRSGLERSFVALVRYAAKAMGTPRLLEPANYAIELVPLDVSGPLVLTDDRDLETRAKRSWREGALYVTAVSIRNRSPYPKVVDERRFLGLWLAAAVETASLQPDARTHAYLISDRPFGRAVAPQRGVW